MPRSRIEMEMKAIEEFRRSSAEVKDQLFVRLIEASDSASLSFIIEISGASDRARTA